MNYRVLFFLIGIIIVLMGSVLFFVFSSGAKQAQLAVISDSEQNTLTNPSVNKGLFSFEQPQYSTLNHSCSAPFVDDAYTSLIMQYETAPESCSLFVNSQLVKSMRNLRPDCRGQCPYEEFSLSTYIGSLDVRDNHEIRICCNDLCLDRVLAAQCS